jgi:hypothetical protein
MAAGRAVAQPSSRTDPARRYKLTVRPWDRAIPARDGRGGRRRALPRSVYCVDPAPRGSARRPRGFQGSSGPRRHGRGARIEPECGRPYSPHREYIPSGRRGSHRGPSQSISLPGRDSSLSTRGRREKPDAPDRRTSAHPGTHQRFASSDRVTGRDPRNRGNTPSQHPIIDALIANRKGVRGRAGFPAPGRIPTSCDSSSR